MNNCQRITAGLKKLGVQWLIKHLCFVSSSVVADSFVLRNPQLLKPANRCGNVAGQKKSTNE